MHRPKAGHDAIDISQGLAFLFGVFVRVTLTVSIVCGPVFILVVSPSRALGNSLVRDHNLNLDDNSEHIAPPLPPERKFTKTWVGSGWFERLFRPFSRSLPTPYSLHSLTLPSTPDQGCPLSLFLLRNIHNDAYLGTY